jgi:3'-5' exoribonuclease
MTDTNPAFLRLRELEPRQTFRSFFLLTQARTLANRNGGSYMALTLQDETATVPGRIWEPDRTWDASISAPAIVMVEGRADTYREELQIIVDSIALYEPSTEEYACLLKTSKWAPDVLMAQLREHVQQGVRGPVLRRLLLAVLDHPEVSARLPIAQAATHNHHAYRSGLVEHTLSMMRLGSTMAAHYERYYPGLINEDLLIAGTLLHDLGKIWELEGELATRYSTVGNLVGHIPMGAAFIASMAAEQGDVPQELVWELQHLVLSHHGEYEYGAPKLPATPEAQLLHYIDNVDARMNMFNGLLAEPGFVFNNRLPGRPLLHAGEMRRTWANAEPVSAESVEQLPPSGREPVAGVWDTLSGAGPGMPRSVRTSSSPSGDEAGAAPRGRGAKKAETAASASAEAAVSSSLSLFGGLEEDR